MQMLSNQTAISITNISKHFLMYKRPEDRLKQMFVPRLQKMFLRKPTQYYSDFCAVKHVSFDIMRGETIGIIGRNGSGKSTLLQMICGTLTPSSGHVKLNGRIAALLELGAGFNPEFSGRENIFMNAAILGLSRKQIENRFDSITEFADIGDFIERPVKSYSSGMYIRLAFAVAINVDPDILIVDEALAVGDEAFQRKCFARIEDIKTKGATIIFVSHSAQTIVQLCDRAMLIDRGEIILEGRPKTVVNQYQRFVNLPQSQSEDVRDEIKNMDGWAGRSPIIDTSIISEDLNKDTPIESDDDSWYDPSLISDSRVEYESHGAIIKNVQVTNQNSKKVNVLSSGQTYKYSYDVEFHKSVRNVGFGMMIKTTNGSEIGGAATDFENSFKLEEVFAGEIYKVEFSLVWRLTPGTYFLNAGVTGSSENNEGYSHRLLDAMAIRFMPSKTRIATGIVDFQAKPKFERVR